MSFLRWSLVLVLMAACSSAPPFDAKALAMEWAAYMQRDYPLRPGDRIGVSINKVNEPSGGPEPQEVIVSPTGTIDLRELKAPLTVAGRSIGVVRTMIAEAYREILKDAIISVSLLEASAQSVYVCGEVREPGAIPFQAGMTMTQAVAAAGSFLITVKESDVRVLRISPDGTQKTIRVNMEAVLQDGANDLLLLPGDVVYCQTSAIADAGNFVELYIRRLLPFSITGVSIGNNGN